MKPSVWLCNRYVIHRSKALFRLHKSFQFFKSQIQNASPVQCKSKCKSLNFQKLHETETMAVRNDSKPIENGALN